ncbi:hypothetical protein [Streptomyces wuyuanensis]|uniref:hypothetical protein n=1 Tax=Streptomyces wuyuanensis TaxID=1196353 RepID=UPI003412ABB5
MITISAMRHHDETGTTTGSVRFISNEAGNFRITAPFHDGAALQVGPEGLFAAACVTFVADELYRMVETSPHATVKVNGYVEGKDGESPRIRLSVTGTIPGADPAEFQAMTEETAKRWAARSSTDAVTSLQSRLDD